VPDPTPVRQLCVLLRDGRVLTDDEGRLPSYVDEHPWIDVDRRALTCGDPSAVLVAPQLPVSPDGHLLMNVFAPQGVEVRFMRTAHLGGLLRPCFNHPPQHRF